MIPSIGRVVVYNHPGSADGKYPPTQSPAIIQVARGDDCDLFVMSRTKGIFFTDATNHDPDHGPCTWSWPVVASDHNR